MQSSCQRAQSQTCLNYAECRELMQSSYQRAQSQTCLNYAECRELLQSYEFFPDSLSILTILLFFLSLIAKF